MKFLTHTLSLDLGLFDMVENHITFAPSGLVTPDLYANLFAIMCLTLGGFALLFALYRLFIKKEIGPLMAWLGGIPMTLMETFADLNGHIWYAGNIPGPYHISNDTALPLVIIGAYCGYCTICYYVSSFFAKEGLNRKNIFMIWIMLCVVETMFEIPLTANEAYIYYGFSPFKVLGFPLWWSWINGTGFFTIAFLMWYIKPRVIGWKNIAILLVPFIGFGFAYGFLAQPNWISINYHIPVFLSYLISIGSLFICYLLVKKMIDYIDNKKLEFGQPISS